MDDILCLPSVASYHIVFYFKVEVSFSHTLFTFIIRGVSKEAVELRKFLELICREVCGYVTWEWKVLVLKFLTSQL